MADLRFFRASTCLALLVLFLAAWAGAAPQQIRFRAQMTVDEFTGAGLSKLLSLIHI